MGFLCINIIQYIYRASDASDESENEDRPKTVWYAMRDADNSSLGCELQDPPYSI